MESYFGGRLGIKLFLILIILCLSTIFLFSFKKPIFDFDKGNYTFYTYSKSSNAKTYEIESKNAEKLKNHLVKIKGESLVITFDDVDKSETYNYITNFLKEKNAVAVKVEMGNFGKSLYYHSNKIPGGVKIGNSLVNIHIVFSKDKVVMGSPLIFGSF